MTTINDTYINALLADASYVLGLLDGMGSGALSAQLSLRMTPILAKYISDNFSVVSVSDPAIAGFNAVVWKGIDGKPYGGQIYVSMRGTQEIIDFFHDADLALHGMPHIQIADMVNWWLRETTRVGLPAMQIQYDDLHIPSPIFVAAPSVIGTGLLSDVVAIHSVDGHSLGGYLATAFVRLFGNQWSTEQINTFNSAGFNRIESSNIQNWYAQIAQIIGPQKGFPDFVDVAAKQINNYAENGQNFTTNDWNPVGFQ